MSTHLLQLQGGDQGGGYQGIQVLARPGIHRSVKNPFAFLSKNKVALANWPGWTLPDNDISIKWNLLKFWYVVQLIKLYNESKFDIISFTGLLIIMGKKTLVSSLRYDLTQPQHFIVLMYWTNIMNPQTFDTFVWLKKYLKRVHLKRTGNLFLQLKCAKTYIYIYTCIYEVYTKC